MPNGQERRQSERFDLAKLIFVSGENETRGGRLIDISRTGAQVSFVSPFERVAHNFGVGDAVSLVIDEVGEMPAFVIRTRDKGVALNFVIDDEEQQMLVAEIKAAFDAARGE